MTGWAVWSNRLYWMLCVGLIALTVFFAWERHTRRIAADLLNPALAQVSNEVTALRQDLDGVRATADAAKTAASAAPQPTPQPVAVVSTRAALPQATSAPVAPTSSSLVNINTAPESALDGLPGIGPSYAAAIVAGRPYKSIDDLGQVKGIGSKTLDKLRPLVTL